MSIFTRFCYRQKLKDIWDERTVYHCPFSLSINSIFEFPFNSFIYEMIQVNPYEKDWLDNGTVVRHHISRQARYEFERRCDYLWWKKR